MKLHYYPETDSLYIELKKAAGTETREIASRWMWAGGHSKLGILAPGPRKPRD